MKFATTHITVAVVVYLIKGRCVHGKKSKCTSAISLYVVCTLLRVLNLCTHLVMIFYNTHLWFISQGCMYKLLHCSFIAVRGICNTKRNLIHIICIALECQKCYCNSATFYNYIFGHIMHACLTQWTEHQDMNSVLSLTASSSHTFLSEAPPLISFSQWPKVLSFAMAVGI